MQQPNIVVVGSANMDLIAMVERFPLPGETLIGSQFRTDFGGKGANQAVAAARLGSRTTLVARIGTDMFGEMIAAHLLAEGISTAFTLADDQQRTGTAAIWVDARGQNMIVITPGANMQLSAADVARAEPAIAAAAVVVAQFEVPTATVLAAFTAAKRSGATTILNPAPARPIPAELMAQCDIIVLNETEIEVLTGQSVPDLAAAERAVRALHDAGAKLIVLTLGASGALVGDGADTRYLPAPQIVAVDSTGAGDAFIGAVATFLAEGHSLQKAVEWANIAASVAVSRLGTQSSFAHRAELAHSLL